MRAALFFLAVVAAAAVSGFSLTKSLESLVFDPDCSFSREDAIVCIGKYVDTNHDQVISQGELSRARQKYLGSFLRLVSYVVSWKVDVSSKKVLQDCDYNKDGRFTADDFRNATKTCLPSQEALCLLKVACDHAAQGSHYKSWF